MNSTLPRSAVERLRTRIRRLYPQNVELTLDRLLMTMGRYGIGSANDAPQSLWSERDAVLITYADSIKSPHAAPLDTLRHFATRHLMGAFSTLHLLPFYPWSSDDGFSVINYRKVDAAVGGWEDIHALKNHFDLMFDWVLNHVSRKSSWMRDFCNCILPYRDYFITLPPETDLAAVVRPRTSPLLTPIATKSGQQHVWTTFSADQIDLNWDNPDVFFEMLDILLGYIDHGARIVRLDAVAFLKKQVGTNCLHLEETHEIIRLLREILQLVAPSVLLLTETNVPHQENISYFGQGDEAHMVYQFTLPPLLLHGLLKGTAKYLTSWAGSLPDLQSETTFFNFTASHDGIGVRPLEGLLPPQEIEFLCDSVQRSGGKLSYRTDADGTSKVYEMNITWFSALEDRESSGLGDARFLCSQYLALALKGIPGVYLHVLTATRNDYQEAEASNMPRRINRKKWNEEELERELGNPQTQRHRLFFRLLKALRHRARCDAFHPDGAQTILSLDDRIFSLIRTTPTSSNQVLCLFNFSRSPVEVDIRPHFPTEQAQELISDTEWSKPDCPIPLAPYQAIWLLTKRSGNPGG